MLSNPLSAAYICGQNTGHVAFGARERTGGVGRKREIGGLGGIVLHLGESFVHGHQRERFETASRDGKECCFFRVHACKATRQIKAPCLFPLSPLCLLQFSLKMLRGCVHYAKFRGNKLIFLRLASNPTVISSFFFLKRKLFRDE